MQHTCVHSTGIDATSLYNYKDLLLKIAMSLGLSAKQSADTINALYSELDREGFDKISKTYSIKVYLSKRLVSKCIFRISNELFSRTDYTDVTILNDGYTSVNLTSIKLKKVPLSYRVTFVLNALAEFSKEEIAEVLNISAVKVKERIKKAHSYIV
ncbi:MAG TPA: hypothetical protein VKA92_13595 [Segetibacter sp.]|nr:hypothetical protein [Segetibacter sp.]